MNRARLAPAIGALALVLLSCSSTPPPYAPEDVPDPWRVERHEWPGFEAWIDERADLTPGEILHLRQELSRARAWLVAWLGPAVSPGDFRLAGTPRASCPPDWELGTAPEVPPVTVVVVKEPGGRCHADAKGIKLVSAHLTRGHATHELVHFLVGSAWAPIDEGLAVYLSERIVGPADGVSLEERARAYRVSGLTPNLREARHSASLSRRDYDCAGAFVGWLIKTYGKSRFFSLYAGKERGYQEVYGQSEGELLARFWTHVEDVDVRHSGPYYRFLGKQNVR